MAETIPSESNSGALAVLVSAGAAAAPVVAWLLAAPPWVIAALAALGAGAAALSWTAQVRRARRDLREIRSALADATGSADDGVRAVSSLTSQIRDSKARGRAADVALTDLQDLLAVIDEPIIGIDAGGRITVCNAAAESLLGVRADRARGRSLEETFTQTEVLGLLSEARGGREARQQVRVSRADGARIWEVAAGPVRNWTGAGPPYPVAVSIRDVTDAALSLQVKTDFVANASHELRTPIAAMRIAVDTLGAVGAEDVAMRDRLMGVVSNNVARLEEMVRDLLDLSRLESPDAPVERSTARLGELTRDLGATFEQVCVQRRLTLKFDVPAELDQVNSDRRLLSLVLGNLIDNATKYAFEGTTIRVVARRMGGADNGPSRGLRIEVSDKGTGIPLDQQARIFERYYQVDAARTPGSPRRGTGLGLSIVKHALRRLGGTIRVQSVWQQGTTMIVELPDSLPDQAP